MSAPRISTVPGVTPVVQLGIGDSRTPVAQPGRWSLSHWDSPSDAHWAGVEPSWLDITCDVHGVDSHVGHARTLERWDVGTCSIDVSNESGWADPLAAALDPSLLMLRPGRQLRWGIRIDATGQTIWRFRGWLDRQAATYDGQLWQTDRAVFECIDALGEVGRADTAKLAAPVGANESATARAQRILSAVSWPADWQQLDAIGTPMLATELGGQVVDMLGQVADSTGGTVFGNYDGRLVLRHRDWQTWDPAQPPDVTIGTDAGAVCPTAIEVTADRAVTLTRSIVNYDGAMTPPVVRDDLPAQAMYGVETAPELTDLLTDNPTQLASVAARLLSAQGASTQPRITAVTLDAARGPAHIAAMLGADPQRPSRWRFYVERAGRVIVDRMLLVTTVEHSWDAHGWVARIGLDDAEPWRAIGGRWDRAYWDTALWAELLTALEALR